MDNSGSIVLTVVAVFMHSTKDTFATNKYYTGQRRCVKAKGSVLKVR